MSHVNSRLRTIYLFSDIGEDSSSEVIMGLYEMSAASRKPILLYINSQGGSVDDGLAIYDAIKLCGSSVFGIVNGICYSSAGIVLQACTKRFMTPNSRFMMHAGSIAVSRMHAREAVVDALESQRAMNRFDMLMSERSGLSMDELERLSRFATYFSAEETVERNLADKVLRSPIKPSK